MLELTRKQADFLWLRVQDHLDLPHKDYEHALAIHRKLAKLLQIGPTSTDTK